MININVYSAFCLARMNNHFDIMLLLLDKYPKINRKKYYIKN